MANATPNFEDDDAVLTLLTDALRAGPGSPEWSRALAATRERSLAGDEDNEYQLLMIARENLESGRHYREVRAGPEFSRRVLGAVDNEPVRWIKRPGSLTAIFMGVAVLAIAIMLTTLVVWLAMGGSPEGENLAGLYLNQVMAAATFDGPLPHKDWRHIGPLKLDTAHGLKPLNVATKPAHHGHRVVQGGAIVTKTGLRSSKTMAVQAVFSFGHVVDDLVPELFVTDSPHYSAERTTTTHEVAWLVRGGRMHVVLPDGRFAGQSLRISDRSKVSVRIIVGWRKVRVVADDHVLYDGISGLSAGPRFCGVRLLRRGPAKDDVRVQSIQVLE